MADESSIIINIKAQSDIDEATKQVAEMLKSARELANQSGKLQQANSTLSTSFQQEASSANKSVQALKDATKQENMLTGASQSMRTELRKVSDELRALAEAGDTSSERFILLADRASQMTDTMGDMQAVVRILASDTKNLDTAMAVGGGLTGTFNAMTSAVALLGGKSEALNDAFLKVQATMSILNGIQQVAQVLDKRSASNVVLRTALTKLFSKAKKEEAVATGSATTASVADASAKTAQATATATATTATNAFTTALLANPVMLIVAGVLALVSGLVALTKWMKESAVEARGFADELRNLERINDSIAKDFSFTAKIAEAEGKGWQEVIAIQKDGANQRLKQAQDTIDRLEEKNRNAKGKLTDEEKEALQKAYDIEQKAWDDLQALNEEYTIKDIQQRREAEEKKLKEQEEYAKKRREQAIEQAELELQQKQILQDLMDQSQQPVKIKVQIEDYGDYEEEVEDIVNPDTYREAMALKMRMEGASEDEIAEYIYNSRKKLLQKQISIAEEGSQEWYELNNQLTEMEIENAQRVEEAQKESIQKAVDYASLALQTLQQLAGEVFGFLSDSVQAELDDLDKYYTTDAEEAKKDANKKYISEKEYQNRKAKLEEKQAKYKKAQTLTDIAIQTALAVMNAMATAPYPLNIAQAVLAGSMGAIQLAFASAKPLAQYEKGRKGGKGEYALVGEKGAEIMYVPQGASIIPHHKIDKPDTWGAYGVPSLAMPDMPTMDKNIIATMAIMQASGNIDYDRVGEAIARHMPKQSSLSINVDRNGVSVSNGHDTHTYLNAKYSGAWN